MPNDADRIIDLYQRHADAYAGERSASLGMESAWLARFCELLPAHGRVLDIGCGCGVPLAAQLIERGHVLTGIDASARMIELCRLRHPQAQWLCADMRQLALPARFDGLIAWDSFFHLDHDDQRGMFEVFQRHAEPGAALMFTSGPEHGVAYGSFQGERLHHASLAPEEYADLLQTHGFVLRANVFNDPDCGGHCVWLAQAV